MSDSTPTQPPIPDGELLDQIWEIIDDTAKSRKVEALIKDREDRLYTALEATKLLEPTIPTSEIKATRRKWYNNGIDASIAVIDKVFNRNGEA